MKDRRVRKLPIQSPLTISQEVEVFKEVKILELIPMSYLIILIWIYSRITPMHKPILLIKMMEISFHILRPSQLLGKKDPNKEIMKIYTIIINKQHTLHLHSILRYSNSTNS